MSVDLQKTDTELVELVLGGEKRAFGELIRRYQGLVYGLAYHRVGNFADAQDIAQESFVKAYRSLGQLKQTDRFLPWLKAVVQNECRMHLRMSRPTVSLDDAELLPSFASITDESWKKEEKRRDIRRAVELLPERSRLVTTLHYLSGMSHAEIARFLGVTANAVAQHLHRARLQLKDMLMERVEEDYMTNRLPESFAEEVLQRVTLYPKVEGQICTAQGPEGVVGFIMGVGDADPRESYITVWMKDKDLGDVTLGTLPSRRTEEPKGRAMQSALAVMDAFGISLEKVVLRLAEERRCRASVDLKQGNDELTLDMRPSDAMGLAVRVGAPILVEEPVVRVGQVGEDEVPVPEGDVDMSAYKDEFQRFRQHDLITAKAFEMGISVEDAIDTVRFRRDEEKGILRVWLEADPEREETFDLLDFGLGADFIFDLAKRRGSTGVSRGDFAYGWSAQYRYAFSMRGTDARMRVILEGGEG